MAKKKPKNTGTKAREFPRNFPEYVCWKEDPIYQMIVHAQKNDPRLKTFVKTVWEQLLKCSVGQSVPDYVSYKQRVLPLLEGEPVVTAGDHRIFLNGAVKASVTIQELYLLMGGLYHKTMKKLSEEGASVCSDQKQREIFSRYKLILSTYEDTQRLMEFFDAIGQEIPPDEDILSFQNKPSDMELILRLEYALNKELEEESHRLMGMLQIQNQNLHPGEFEYFSAMSYMKGNHWDKALREISKIPPDTPEYKKSLGMTAEILARKGDPDAFLRFLNGLGEYIKLEGEAMLCYIQTLILNMHMDARRFAEMNSPRKYRKQLYGPALIGIEKWLMERYQEGICISADSPVCGYFQRNLFTAVEEVYQFYCFGAERAAYDDESIETFLFPGKTLKGMILLWMTQPACFEDLIGMLENPSLEQVESFVLDYFDFSPPEDGQRIDLERLEIFSEAYLMFLGDAAFVDYFLKNRKLFRDIMPKERFVQLMTTAYLSAVSSELVEQADSLHSRLTGILHDFDNCNRDDVEYHKILSLLSPYSKLLYSSAEWQYREAMEQDYGWKDAGMISLGFFRLLEVELRDGLFVTGFGKNHPQIRELLRMVAAYEENGGEKQYYSFGREKLDLKTALIKLKEPKKMTLEQMECALILLSERCSVPEQWRDGVAALREILYSVLSEQGKAAARNNEIANLIREEKRIEYRNPPAHARYLSIEKAGECRGYVNEKLRLLICDWMA